MIARCLGLALLIALPGSAAAGGRFPQASVTLSNGMTGIFIKYPSPGAVAYGFGFKVGSGKEIEKGKTGFAHFFEHLMFRGTKNRSAKEFGDLYVKLGCENNAWTSNDLTFYNGSVSSEGLPQIIQAEADRFAHLQFDEKALREEAGAVLGEYNKTAAQPELKLEEALLAAAFTEHPYGHTTLGTREDILQYTERYKDVWPFLARHYRPENAFAVFVGDVDLKAGPALLEKEFGSWKPAPIEAQPFPVEPEQTAPRVADVSWPTATQARVIVAYKIPAFRTANRDSAALQVLSELLFSSPTSEFQKEYRFRRKWIEPIHPVGFDWADPGLWQVWLKFTEEGATKTTEVLEAALKAVASARETPFPKARIEAARDRLVNRSLLGWYSGPEAFLGALAQFARYETDAHVLDRIASRLREVTPADVQAFAKAHLVDARRTVVTLKGKQP